MATQEMVAAYLVSGELLLRTREFIDGNTVRATTLDYMKLLETPGGLSIEECDGVISEVFAEYEKVSKGGMVACDVTISVVFMPGNSLPQLTHYNPDGGSRAETTVAVKDYPEEIGNLLHLFEDPFAV